MYNRRCRAGSLQNSAVGVELSIGFVGGASGNYRNKMGRNPAHVHKKQVRTYLKLTGKKVAFLVNFNSAHLKDKESLIRIVNNF